MISSVTFTTCLATYIFRVKKNIGESFFPLHFDVYTDMDITERASGRDKKQIKEKNFAGRITWKFNSCSSEKMRNASGQQDEKWEAVKKKKEQEHKQQK